MRIEAFGLFIFYSIATRRVHGWKVVGIKVCIYIRN